MKRVASLLVACMLLASAAAHAQEQAAAPVRREPSPGDLATARNALKEGLALREKGELPASLARLATAYDIVPTPVTAFELGKANMMVGRILTASEMFKKVGRLPVSPDESERSAEARSESARLTKELEPRIPSLRIHLKVPAQATASVRIDDETIELDKAGETLRLVDPGTHVVGARAGDGPEQEVKIQIGENETKDVELTPQWIPPKTPAKDASGKQIIYVKSTNPLTFVFFGLASASFAFTIVGGAQFFARQAQVSDECTGKYCRAEADGDIKSFQGWALAFAAGGIATLTFVSIGTYFALNPNKDRVVVGLAPGGLRVSGKF